MNAEQIARALRGLAVVVEALADSLFANHYGKAQEVAKAARALREAADVVEQ